jgi:large subunit ribosomal protein L35
MLCTIAVVDPDVPDPKKDRFRYRCHWIVSNIPISPMQTTAVGYSAKPADTLVPYLPPHAQKGAPYHRYAMIVFKQPEKIDAAALEGNIDRDDFTMRGFQSKNKLCSIGAFMWRVEWDSHTKEIMQKHNLPGWDIMYKRSKDVVPS